MKTIGIIGYGNMGSAIAERLKAEYQILIYDKDENKTRNLSGINVAKGVEDLLNRVANLVLAVKPQDFDPVLAQIKDNVKSKLLISIAAGIPTGYIEKKLGKVRLIRAMPNLPAKIGKGMTCLCKGQYCFEGDLSFVQGLFERLGKTMPVEENLMDAVTAISGSGPGYFFDLIKNKKKEEWLNYGRNIFMQELSAAAVELGFSRQQAELLSRTSVDGSMSLLIETGLSPEVLCSQICSKGGTTEAGLAVLHVTNSLEEAVRAALKRAKELAKKE